MAENDNLNPEISPRDGQRDGSSQAARRLAALDPDYAQVDERSLADLLEFARQYAKKLRYYNAANQPDGNWAAFLEGVNAEEAAAFIENPDTLPADRAEVYRRPQLALFLTFLQLFRHPQKQLNALTRRHLDFYFRDVLRMRNKAARPDRVNILVEPAADVPQIVLPQGTLLDAGSDSQGQPLVYRTDREIVVNQARVARVSSLYAEKRYINQKEEWRNAYAAEDAHSAVPGTAGNGTNEDHPHWHTFGDTNRPAAVIGWAISSPVLMLSQGYRSVELRLGFQAGSFDGEEIESLLKASPSPFRIQISTAHGWMEPKEKPTIELKPESHQLTFPLIFDETADAIVPLPVQQNEIPSPWPVLRLLPKMLPKTAQADEKSAYQIFKDLLLDHVDLKVQVGQTQENQPKPGLSDFRIRNDETVLDAGKPFEPFGASPSVGSRLYLSHPELVCKKLDKLTFCIEWMGAPGDMAKHYTNYDIAKEQGDKKQGDKEQGDEEQGDNELLFTVNVSSVDRRKPVKPKDYKLFADSDARKKHQIALESSELSGTNQTHADEKQTATDDDDIQQWPRYFQWELKAPDFQHATYPTVAAKKSIALAKAIASKNVDEVEVKDYQVNPPYTPKIKSLTLAYSASISIEMDKYKTGSQSDRLLHIHPFGWAEIQPERETLHSPFLPRYTNEGELYIGLQGVQPAQNVSLLFQLAEGSADPDQTPEPKVRWSYLSGNCWQPLDEGHLMRDGSTGLIQSGSIEFALPKEASPPHTILPADLFWLRAAVARNTRGICDTIGIHTQAVSATLVDSNTAADHFSQPLHAASITDLIEPLPSISAIRQPYASDGGRSPEGDTQFYTRTSERLRHKHRALTVWDYEHMILEQFPQIYKAKCLPADPAAPGKLTIIVIPDIRYQIPLDPFEPKATPRLLADIKSYLEVNCPRFASITVKNPSYVQVKVRLVVRFTPGHDEHAYKRRLNKEVTQFMSPWAYDQAAEDIVIGGAIYANDIVNFVSTRAYVEHVAHIGMFPSTEEVVSSLEFRPAPDPVVTTKPDQVLVSARGHVIEMISTGANEVESQ
jgi:hypothetical protein